jgi:hypothetical protein
MEGRTAKVGGATRARRRRWAGSDRGVTVVEAAIASAAFFTLLFGIIEGALLVNGNLTIAASTTDGARAAAISGNELESDFRVVQAVNSASKGAPRTSIVRLVVFKASGPDAVVPAGCKAGTPSSGGAGGIGACNVYTPGAHFHLTDPAQFDCGATSPSRFYCPTTRKIAVNAPNGPPDYLGVFIEMRHSFVTGLFGRGVTLTRTSVVRLEPQALNG